MDFGFVSDLWANVDVPTLFAQQFQQDVLGDIKKGWDSFVATKQYVSLIIGFTLGYLLRSVTNG
ncbi:MAG: hypothetical protein RMK91_01535 [Pseudanabaenaceae cyanobacterium SKYGB_i_bin29]|nr:hypothetical protein [Pseudanabaenaceae cyanobacterium SKYG29]MDW8420531.1 hypothetical protein [Pseudanabaenaceae cyanobacterium SKYGB_i_bin29]